MEVIVDIKSGVYKEHVVRCSDCKSYKNIDGVVSLCVITLNDVRPDDYCSMGEDKNANTER